MFWQNIGTSFLVASTLDITTFAEIVANWGRGSSYISGSVLLLEHVNSLCIKNLLTTVWCTLFGGRSPACSQTCKIVRLPPSDIGPSSAM